MLIAEDKLTQFCRLLSYGMIWTRTQNKKLIWPFKKRSFLKDNLECIEVTIL